MIEMMMWISTVLRNRIWALTAGTFVRAHGVVIGAKVKFFGYPTISRHRQSVIKIGDRAVLVSHSSSTALGVSRACILRTMRENAEICIGADTGASGVVICAVSTVSIGSNCLIGSDVMIVDNDFHPIAIEGRRYSRDFDCVGIGPVRIEDDVFIGARTIVLKGVTIGRGSVIGAGSVVVSDVPPGVIAAGNPARVVRHIRTVCTS